MARNNAIVPDNAAIHDGRINTDQTVVSNRAAMNGTMVSDGAMGPYVSSRVIANMQHRKILNICIVTDNDLSDF